MVFDGCAPSVRRWNGYVPSLKSNLQRKYEEQCREIFIPAEELGLEVHEELYGGGTPANDETCIGFLFPQNRLQSLILEIEPVGCRTRHAAFSVEHLKLLHKVAKSLIVLIAIKSATKKSVFLLVFQNSVLPPV